MADDDEVCVVCCVFLLWLYVLAWDIAIFFPSVSGWEWIVLAVVGAIGTWFGLASLEVSIDENPSTAKNTLLLVLYIIMLIITLYNPVFNSKFSFGDSAFWYVVALIVLPIIPFIVAGGATVKIWDYFAARMTTPPYVSSSDDELEFYTPIHTVETSQVLFGGDAIDVYTPIQTMGTSQIPMVDVTPVLNIDGVTEDAQCPYCGYNIRDTFHKSGGVVKCAACGTFHHKECFDYYKKCGSKKCKLRKT